MNTFHFPSLSKNASNTYERSLYPQARAHASDVYIGRKYKLRGYKLEASKWGNPFRVGHSLQEVLNRYRRHVLRNPLLMQSLAGQDARLLVPWTSFD